MRGSRLLRSEAKHDRVVLALALLVGLLALGSLTYLIMRGDDEAITPGIPAWAQGATDIQLGGSYLYQPDDLSRELADSDVVIDGVISLVYPAVWATSEGKGPGGGLTPEHLVGGSAYQIRTPVQFDVKEVFKGEDIPDTIKFSFLGGRVEDAAHIEEKNTETYVSGTRMIIFLGKGLFDTPAAYVDPEWPFYPNLTFSVVDKKAVGPREAVPLESILDQLR